MEENAEALEVLRAIWRGSQQTAADLGDSGCETSCKRMADAGVGYQDFGAGHGGDLGAAWRARLEREGKLSPSGDSVRELVMGPHVAR